MADKKVADLSCRQKIILEYVIWIIYRLKIVFIVNPLFEKDMSLYPIIYSMINRLKQGNITVVILVTNLLSADQFEGDTVYVSNGVQLDEEQI